MKRTETGRGRVRHLGQVVDEGIRYTVTVVDGVERVGICAGRLLDPLAPHLANLIPSIELELETGERCSINADGTLGIEAADAT